MRVNHLLKSVARDARVGRETRRTTTMDARTRYFSTTTSARVLERARVCGVVDAMDVI